ARVDFRFSHPRDAEGLPYHSSAAAQRLEPRQDLGLKHMFDLARRAREKRYEDSLLFKPQPRRRAPRVFKHFGPHQHLSLALVDVRHRVATAGKFSLDSLQD